MYKPKKKRPCKICGTDLNVWGPDRRGTCPDCQRAMKDTPVKCAGRCNNTIPIRLMDAVVLYFEPGIRGGKKFTVYYCQQCSLAAKSRARTIHEAQQAELKKVEGRRVRETSKRKRGGKV